MPNKPWEFNVELALREYAANLEYYERLAAFVKDRITRALRERNVKHQIVYPRVKDQESLREKLVRSGKKYTQLTDVTDIVGVRVITYLPNDVDVVAGIVDELFATDQAKSVDKRARRDPEAFGYSSLHRICQLRHSDYESVREPQETRWKPRENEGSRTDSYVGTTPPTHGYMLFEIQIRTVLQHAWAEIQHELGYKAPTSIPRSFKREFSRLAALLEKADEGFQRLKEDIGAYINEVRAAIEAGRLDQEIDASTLAAFLDNNELFKSIEDELSKLPLRPNETPRNPNRPDCIDPLVDILSKVGIQSTRELEDKLAEHRGALVRLAATDVRDLVSMYQASAVYLPYARGFSIVLLADIIVSLSPPSEADSEDLMYFQQLQTLKGVRLASLRGVNLNPARPWLFPVHLWAGHASAIRWIVVTVQPVGNSFGAGSPSR